MNFLKRAGAILMLLAIFASSCNKYADDFTQLNTKLDALATQVAGVTQLVTDMAAVKAQVTALQTAVAALPTQAQVSKLQADLTTVLNNINAITTTLNTVASTGTATKAVVDKLTTDLATLAATVKTNDAAMTAQLATLTTNDASQTAQLTSLIASNANLLVQITAVQTKLNPLAQQGATGDPVTAATIYGLQALLNGQTQLLNQILANSAMYNGDVSITTPAEVTFWSKKISVLSMINGNLTINTTNLTAKLDSVNFITKNIQTVLGSGHNVWVTSVANATLLDLSHLTSVSGDYVVGTGIVGGTPASAAYDVNDANLMGVGGNFTIWYDGPYAYPNLSTVGGNLTLAKVATVTGTSVGTTSINLPYAKVVGSAFDAVGGPAGVISYPVATSIVLAGGVTSVTGAVATQITLGSSTYAGLTVAPSTTAASVVDLSAATTSTGAITVGTVGTPLVAGSTVKLTKLASSTGAISIVSAGTTSTVDLSALATATTGVTLTGFATVTLPVLVSAGTLTSDATTVTLPKFEWATVPALSKVVTLTLGNVNASVNLDNYNGTLVTATVNGKAQTTWAATLGAVATTSSAKLTTLTLTGNLASANLVGLTALTSLTTSGNINTFKVDGASVLTAMTLGHTYYQPGNVANGGPGSDLIIKNNPKLTALKSSTDYPASIIITNNATLASVDLSSYKTPLLAAAGATTTITINTNALVGDYVNAVAITPTTPYAETKITSADLHTLKALVAAYPTAAGAWPSLTLAINIDKVTLGGVAGSTALLSARMVFDSTIPPAGTGGHDTSLGAPFNFGTPATGITLAKEFTLVQ